MELELSKPLLSDLTKRVNINSVLSNLSSNKTDFEDVREYFRHLPPTRNILNGHTDYLRFLKVSPDGQTIATAAVDGTVRLWDIQHKKEHKVFLGHSKYIESIEFSPDGRFLVSGDSEGKILMWNLENLEQEAEFTGFSSIKSLKISNDGKYLVAAGGENFIKVWLLEDRTEKFSIDAHEGTINTLEISKDSKYIASGSDDKSVKIWDLEEGSLLYEYSHSNFLSSLFISEDGEYLASLGYEKTLKLWNLKEQKLQATIQGHTDIVYCLAISSDSKYLASGSFDTTVRLWNIPDSIEQAILKGHSQMINCLVFTHNVKYLASGSKDFTIRLWNLHNMSLESELIGHTWEIRCLEVTLDDHFLISASMDKTVRIWNLKTTQESAVIDDCDAISNLNISDDGKRISSFSSNGTFKVRNLENFSELTRLDEEGSCSALTRDWSYLAIGTHDNRVLLVDMATEKKYELGSHTNTIQKLRFTSDKKYLISCSYDSLIKVFNLQTKKEEAELSGHSSFILSLAVSQDSKYIVSGSEDNTVRVWNLAESREEYLIDCQHFPISSVAITSDNRFIIYGSEDGKIRVWNHYDRKIEMVLDETSYSINDLTITNDDKYFISASYSAIKIWNLREMKEEKLLDTNNDSASVLYVSRDSKYLAAGFDDGKIRLWDLASCISEYGTATNFKYDIKGYDYTFEKEYFMKVARRDNNMMHRPLMDKMLIMPIKVNPLHLYAYQNDTRLMAQALKSGCYFINTKYGESPVTICLRRNSRKCLDLLLNYIIKLGRTNEVKQSYIIESITNDIPDLIKSGSKLLPDFLSILLKKNEPSFIIPISDLPIRIENHDFNINPSSFTQDSSAEGTEELVEIASTRFKWNLQRGSSDSIKLLQSILESPVQQIYKTDLIKSLIDYKWDDMYAINLVFTLLYMINLGFLMALVFLDNSHDIAIRVSSIGFISINIYFLLYELYQSITTGASYFLDVWNYIDIIRSPVCIAWGLLSLAEYTGDFYDVMTLLTNLLCWIRGLTYFRTFKRTRIFVRMVLEVAKDTSSFLILLTYTTLAYGTLFVASSGVGGGYNFVSAMKDAYLLDLASFEAGSFTNSQWVVFFMASIINCIIMLNLLISILGDSYSKVQETLIESDYSQMLDAILELEKLMVWNRNKGVRIYLQICRELEDDDESSALESQVRVLNKKVESISFKFEQKFKTTEDILREIHDNQIKDLNKKVDDISQKFNQTDTILREIYEKVSKIETSS